jgi:hypothetical protein
MNDLNKPSPNQPFQAFSISLRQFEAAIQADQRVLGMLYTGSLGRGTADRFSDLDIEVWVTDAAYAEAETTAQEILGYLGAIQLLYSRATGYTTAFFGIEWQPIDLALNRKRRKDLYHHLLRYSPLKIPRTTWNGCWPGREYRRSRFPGSRRA